MDPGASLATFALYLLYTSSDTSALTAVRLAFSRAPTKEEMKFANEALQQLKAKWKTELGDKAKDEVVHKNALKNFCRALFNASEFQYVD